MLGLQEGETPGLLSRKVLRNIASASFSFPPDVSLSAECLDFISRVLCVSPSERLSAEEMLNHPWLAGKVVPLHVDTEESQQTLSEIQNALGEISGQSRLVSEQLHGSVHWLSYSAMPCRIAYLTFSVIC